ncbi:unnamed protein product [Ostreobium quekettii]|uniref:Uncharacterized protein n=1 Tax=Ostreobium quekettii TaxID=121088 RepID=A0A8S1J4E6_9CHLO|nr:unnamed protein product [Ostreobium quekettii]
MECCGGSAFRVHSLQSERIICAGQGKASYLFLFLLWFVHVCCLCALKIILGLSIPDIYACLGAWLNQIRLFNGRNVTRVRASKIMENSFQLMIPAAEVKAKKLKSKVTALLASVR